jgi:cytochrome c peroxidase
VLNISQDWDGRARDLREQAKGPVQTVVEMNSNPKRTVETLRSMTGYVEQFRRAFPGELDAVTFENTAKAIEVFEATLLTPDSPFDHYLSGDDGALNSIEKDGLSLFMSKGCKNCHGGANLGGSGHFAFGVVERPGDEILPPADKGRFAVTQSARDEYVFKSPSLRNIALTAPYFHSGQVWNLKQAVKIMGSSQLGVTFNEREADGIVEFLKTLTGRQPSISYPVLPPHTASTPLPDANFRK